MVGRARCSATDVSLSVWCLGVNIGPSTPLAELERLYADTPLGPLPTGTYDGQVLRWVETNGPCVGGFLALEWFGFVVLPWGIRFDKNLWWFGTPLLAAGTFVATPGPSRWRDTEAYRLTYDTSHLPKFFRDILYDEMKPLDADTVLGLGGVNRDVGQGDHFFFLLTRRS